jgi:two-component system phosphate regulon sensor histidine kinase PhoR
MCQFLRARPETQTLPILMLTSSDQTEDVVTALTAGANDYVRKPASPAELMARAAALLRSHRLLLRAEKAEHAVRSLIAQLPDAVIVVDAEGRIAFANDEAERMFGHALLGQPIQSVLPTLDPAQLAKSEGQETRDVSVGDQTYAPIVGRLQLDDAPMTTITLRNVTAKQLAETRRLDFYSVIAHDLRSPLNAMNMRTHLLLDGARGALSEPVRADLQKILDRIKGLALTIDDFLDLARLEAKSVLIESTPTNLREVIDESIEILAPLAEAKHMSIQVSEASRIAPLAVDRRRIGQVISNLLSNAIKFSPDRGDIVISVAELPDGTEVTFTDSGPGIEAVELPQLFQRYARIATSKIGGTGLGLMIVREVIEAHGGSVRVASEVGHGSSFSFLLPKTLQALSA